MGQSKAIGVTGDGLTRASGTTRWPARAIGIGALAVATALFWVGVLWLVSIGLELDLGPWTLFLTGLAIAAFLVTVLRLQPPAGD